MPSKIERDTVKLHMPSNLDGDKASMLKYKDIFDYPSTQFIKILNSTY